MDIDLPIAHISLRPEEFPQQVTYFDDETPTCTLWETPVVALAADMTYHGNGEGDLTPYQEFYMRFMTSGSIGFDATFYAPEGRVANTKDLMNTIAGYCLDPENTFTIEAIKAMAPEAWNSDSGFTNYLPEAFEDYYLQYHFMNVTSGEKTVLFNYSESESDDVSLRWRIRQTHGAVEAVDIDQPKTYDLRSNESIDSSDRFTLGLSGQLSDEAIDTLANPIIRLDDLTEDVIAGRIFEDYESYYEEPYLALSVLYPDFTVVTFEGHWDPTGLYEIFRSLPLGDDHDEEV